MLPVSVAYDFISISFFQAGEVPTSQIRKSGSTGEAWLSLWDLPSYGKVGSPGPGSDDKR